LNRHTLRGILNPMRWPNPRL